MCPIISNISQEVPAYQVIAESLIRQANNIYPSAEFVNAVLDISNPSVTSRARRVPLRRLQ